MAGVSHCRKQTLALPGWFSPRLPRRLGVSAFHNALASAALPGASGSTVDAINETQRRRVAEEDAEKNEKNLSQIPAPENSSVVRHEARYHQLVKRNLDKSE